MTQLYNLELIHGRVLDMWRGILVDQALSDLAFINTLQIFATKHDGSWIIYGVEIDEDALETFIPKIQEFTREGSWYTHFYSDTELIVVFKHAVFRMNKSERHQELLEYARSLGIPDEQMQITPLNQDQEKDYFG